MLRGSAILILLGASGIATAALASGGSAATAQAPVITRAQTNYTMACGGCHGLLGVAADESIPRLRDKVGTFMCTQEGREYLIRLPNIAFANLDDEELAEMMNFVVFGLGGESVGDAASTRPFTADEVGSLRKTSLKGEQIMSLRERVWGRAETGCDAHS